MFRNLNLARISAVALVLIFSWAARAQVNTATLLGSIKDSSGAAVPNATIVAGNLETGQERTVISDATGNYAIPNLQVGHYKLSVTAPGFKTTIVSDIELQVAQMATAH